MKDNKKLKPEKIKYGKTDVLDDLRDEAKAKGDWLEFRKRMKFLFIPLILVLPACSASTASSVGSVQVIPAPLPGYTCFAIQNSAGDTVGGNCVKE